MTFARIHWNPIFLFAAVPLLLAVVATMKGQIRSNVGGVIDRHKRPKMFWILVGGLYLATVFFLVCAIVSK